MKLRPIFIDRTQLKFRVEDHARNEIGRANDMKSTIEIFKERYPYSSDDDAKPFIYEIVAFTSEK